MLRLLGKPHFAPSEARLMDLPDKAFVLCAMLCLHYSGAASRDQVRTLLWEDADAEGASENLRWLLSRVRKWERQHGVSLLNIGRTTVALSPDLSVDIRSLQQFPPIESAEALEELLALNTGELLAATDPGLGPQLLDLVVQYRGLLRGRVKALLLDAAARIGGERGENLLRGLVAENPDDERVLRALMVHLARERGTRAVHAAYAEARRRLLEDFEAEPSIETQALFAQLVPTRVPHLASTIDTAADPTPGGVPRIVLLPPQVPFKIESDKAAIADALVEDVSLQLTRMRTFAMFAPHTARQVTGHDPVAAVAPFGVSYVASTLLLPAAGGGLRLALSLIRTSTNSIVFADQFDFELASLGQRFAELAEAIAAHLSTAVEKVEVGAYRRTGAASAYVQYLLGTRTLDVSDLKALRRARHHFARALELEPNYVPALTGIARTLTKEALALRSNDRDLVRRAMSLADRAAMLDPLDPGAWREKAMASLYLHDIDASLAHLDAAQSRARHHADIIAEKAEVLVHASRPQEAKRAIVEAIDLNPIAPDDYYWILGSAEFFLGRYSAAGDSLRRMRKMENASRLAAASAAMAGDMAASARYRDLWLEMHPASRVADVPDFMPHASRADIEHFCDALRRAGFP